MNMNAQRDQPLVQIAARNPTELQIRLSGAAEQYHPQAQFEAIEAALEDALARFPHVQEIELEGSSSPELSCRLQREGLAILADKRHLCSAAMLQQRARFWLRGGSSNGFPLTYRLTDGKRHPLRPPKPTGVVYSRYISWLDCTFSLRRVQIDADLGNFHRWMNQPRVAQFWQENGDLDKHRQYLQGIEADPHIIALMGCFADRPCAYLEVYWAKEDRIAPFYDAQDYDRGWHGLVGEESFLGRHYVAAWIPSFMHYMFLDDARTQRIVGEPRHDNSRIIANLERNGFARLKHFDFPHKRALLVMLLRERFFGDRLLSPQWDSVAAPVRQSSAAEL